MRDRAGATQGIVDNGLEWTLRWISPSDTRHTRAQDCGVGLSGPRRQRKIDAAPKFVLIINGQQFKGPSASFSVLPRSIVADNERQVVIVVRIQFLRSPSA
jgi:hypothetical protein